jgi:hypothetical protein
MTEAGAPRVGNQWLCDSTGEGLRLAAIAAHAAATACGTWEEGGDEAAVSDTAAGALERAQIALEAVVADEPWDNEAGDPETRRARLAQAGWLALLAGTDEHGQSGDLQIAGQLFERAAKA